MKWGAVVVAAGSGTATRAAEAVYSSLPVCRWSAGRIQTFAAMPEIVRARVATEPEWIERDATPCGEAGAEAAASRRARRNDAPRERARSNRRSGRWCEGTFVHDGARPLITAYDVRAGMAQVRPGRAALLAEPVTDTIKRVDPQSRRVVETLEREDYGRRKRHSSR